MKVLSQASEKEVGLLDRGGELYFDPRGERREKEEEGKSVGRESK